MASDTPLSDIFSALYEEPIDSLEARQMESDLLGYVELLQQIDSRLKSSSTSSTPISNESQ